MTNELRAGDSHVTQAAWLLITIWKLGENNSNTEAFQQPGQIKPPHHQLFGDAKKPPHQGTCGSSSSLSQKVDNFHGREATILSPSEALAYLENRYGSNYITVDGDQKISDWQTAKKSCYWICFGVNPEDYGAKQSDFYRLNKVGIVKYVQEGGRLPSDKHIQAIQGALKSFCEDVSKSIKNEVSTFRGEPSITYFNERTRQTVIFQRDGTDLKTGYKMSRNRIDDYLRTGNIGNQKNQPKQ